jgi:hypothetical protein
MGPNEAKKCADKAQPLKQQADELTKVYNSDKHIKI